MALETDSSLRQQILGLVPWAMDVELCDGLTTAIAREASQKAAREWGIPLPNASPRDGFQKTLHTIYPGGLQQRSFLDLGCNCGAYCVWTKELGSGRTLGIDNHPHWIRQAELLKRCRKLPLLEFAQLDICDLPKQSLPRFDVVLMKGLLHCLADPLRGLQIAADMTREVLIVNTPVSDYLSPEPGDGALFMNASSGVNPWCGSHPISWLPSGPRMLTQWLQSRDFAEVKLHFHTQSAATDRSVGPFTVQGHVEIIASRVPGLTERLRTVVRAV